MPTATIQKNLLKEIKGLNIDIDSNELKINNTNNQNNKKIDEIKNKRIEILQRNNRYNNYYEDTENATSSEQTIYDYKIIENYKLIGGDTNNISSFKEIFLTYQSAIHQCSYYNNDTLIYSSIMFFRKFSIILLVDSILSNINQNSQLARIIIEDTYRNILSDKLMSLLDDILNNQNIPQDTKDNIIAFSIDTNNWNKILTKDNVSEILEKIQNNDKKHKEEIEKRGKKHKEEVIIKVIIALLLSFCIFFPEKINKILTLINIIIPDSIIRITSLLINIINICFLIKKIR